MCGGQTGNRHASLGWRVLEVCVCGGGGGQTGNWDRHASLGSSVSVSGAGGRRTTDMLA